jgi:hypothetical protein
VFQNIKAEYQLHASRQEWKFGCISANSVERLKSRHTECLEGVLQAYIIWDRFSELPHSTSHF